MSLFEILRQQKKELELQQLQSGYGLGDIYIKLDTDDKGTFIQITDKQGQEIQPDYTAFTGSLRNLIKSINSIADKNAFLIDWENPGNHLYLHENPHLVEPILSSGLLVDIDLNPILSAWESKTNKPSPAILKVVLTPQLANPQKSNNSISKKENNSSDNEINADKAKKLNSASESEIQAYEANLLLQPAAGISSKVSTIEGRIHHFWFITENYVLLPKDNIIIETQPIGSFFNQVRIFNAERIIPQDLAQYLSLLYTYLEGFQLELPSFRVQLENEPLQIRPAIIFEKIDENQNLTLRIGQNLHSAPIGFLDQYNVSHMATINQMEKTISVSPIAPLDIQHYVSRVVESLKKHAPKGKKKSSEFLDIQGQQFYLHESLAGPFIYNELPSLIIDYDLIGSEKLKAYKIKVDMPKLDLTLGHNIDFLEGTGTANLDFDGQKVSILDALQQYEKQRYIRLTDGTHALVNEQYMNRLKRLFKKNKNKKGEISVSFFDLPAIEELIEEKQRSHHFKQAREVYQGLNKINEDGAVLPKIQAALRPYQIQGFQWMSYLVQHKLGGCLADDMGLGKTIQTIAILAAAYGGAPDSQAANGKKKAAKVQTKTKSKSKSTKVLPELTNEQPKPPSIIIMPRSLLFNWRSELNKFAPWLTIYTWHGQNRDIDQAMDHQIILTTYGMFRNDIKLWKEQSFLYGILDESQAIKNLNSQVHKAVLLLSASHRLALSGTPVENNLAELFALFRYLNPALLGTADQFNSDYLYPIQKNNDREAVAELRRKIYPFILRRLKKDVLTDLPDKQEQTIYVEMNSAQARFYEQRRQFYKDAIDQQVAAKGIKQAQFFIFQAMNELRQIASIPEARSEGRIPSPKLEALMEQLEEAIANDHKILIFVNYLNAIESISEALDKQGVGFLTMTGSTRDRQSLVDRFQNDPEIRVFIMTLKTGGTGLNLTAADMVFIFDPWWNKAAENQAIDRAHRIGQTSKVQSYKLITLGTIEEKILQLQELKSNLVDDLIAADSQGGSGSIKSMTEEDIQFILG